MAAARLIELTEKKKRKHMADMEADRKLKEELEEACVKSVQLEGSVHTLTAENIKLKSEHFHFETITDVKQLEFLTGLSRSNGMLYGHSGCAVKQ